MFYLISQTSFSLNLIKNCVLTLLENSQEIFNLTCVVIKNSHIFSKEFKS